MSRLLEMFQVPMAMIHQLLVMLERLLLLPVAMQRPLKLMLKKLVMLLQLWLMAYLLIVVFHLQ